MSTELRSKRVIRSHTKSRTGCTHCKRRRVKCDEVRPVCGTCERRKTECVYENYKRGTSNSEAQQMIPLQPKQPPFTYLDMDSLRLFYHWTHVTSKTFSHTEFTQHILPEIAFNNPALMHAILALSALHLHNIHGPQYSEGETDYLSLAVFHRNNIHPLLGQITERHVSLVALAFLQVIIYADPTPHTLDIFSVVGSMYDNIKEKHLEIPSVASSLGWKNGQPFTNNVFGSRSQVRVPFPSSLQSIHLPISSSNDTNAPPLSPDFIWPDPTEVSDPTTSSTYAHATQTLMHSWYLFQRPGCEMAAAFLWSSQFTERFYTYLVVERRQRALVLLYYFCFILSWLADSGNEYNYGQEQSQQPYKCWWASGQRKFGDSAGLVVSMLDERWRRCITTIAS